MIKSFRGILADGGQDRIRLSTIKGKVGYKINKFEVFPNIPGGATQESIVMAWKTSQTTIPTSSGTVDFTDPDLLGAAYYVQYGLPATGQNTVIIVFDNEVVNQDIYITNTDNDSAALMNYYIEMELIDLSDMQAEYTTIKNLRANAA